MPAWSEPPPAGDWSTPTSWPPSEALNNTVSYDRASPPTSLPSDQFAYGKPPADQAPPYQQPQDQPVYGHQPADQPVYGQHAADQQVYGQNRGDQPPSDRLAYGQHSPGQPAHGQPAHGQPAFPQGPGDFPPSAPGGAGGGGEPPVNRPGSNLSRDPSDPDRPFVTAGQISGSRTPPPERQQELWNTVFGDNYQSMGDQEALDEPGKPIWIYALAGSVAIALVAALLWAFLAGPLASDDPPAANTSAAKPTGSSKPSTSKSPTTIPQLPKFPGKAAPVAGTVSDSLAKLTVPRLGGTWLLDQRVTVKATYGFDTRQYVRTAPDTYAQILTGPLSPKLASSYTTPDELEPVIKQVVLSARKRFFAQPNTVRKLGQQSLKSAKGRVIAYELTSGETKTTIVTAAVNTGGDVPSIVYISIPSASKQLLPDINTIVKGLKTTP